MTSTNHAVEIFKRDARGHIRVPAERREALLDEFERSGMSGAEFARFAGVAYGTFATWAQRRRKQREAASAVETRQFQLVEATVETESPEAAPTQQTSGLLIELPGSSRLRVESSMQLRLAAELLSLMAQGMNQNGSRRC
jgi:hypothetical protein